MSTIQENATGSPVNYGQKNGCSLFRFKTPGLNPPPLGGQLQHPFFFRDACPKYEPKGVAC